MKNFQKLFQTFYLTSPFLRRGDISSGFQYEDWCLRYEEQYQERRPLDSLTLVSKSRKGNHIIPNPLPWPDRRVVPYGLSTHIAIPMPPPIQSAATPFFWLVRFSAWRSVTKTLAPEAPIGWPRAIAPPLMFTWKTKEWKVYFHIKSSKYQLWKEFHIWQKINIGLNLISG